MTIQDKPTGVALWRHVADGIERGIADGRYGAGEKLPGETELADIYRVNRHTVRRALATLAERGLVRAERGSGTYVESPKLAYPLRSRTRFSEIAGAGGREPQAQLIGAWDDVATRDLARQLGLKAGAPLIRIEALRLADKTPICVGTNWLSAERFPDFGKVYERVRSMTKAPGALRHQGLSPRLDQGHRGDHRRDRCDTAWCRTRASDLDCRFHRCGCRRHAAQRYAFALRRRARRIRGR